MARLKVGILTVFDGLMPDHASLHELDALDTLLDWHKIEKMLSSIHSVKVGGASYPPVMMFRSLLLQTWYALSDVKIEKMLNRDLLFRKFSGFSLMDTVPDHSTISRFRGALIKKNLYEPLLKEVNKQLKKQGAIVEMGEISIIDATVIEAHQCRKKKGKNNQNTQDPDGGWSVKAGAKGKIECTYGYKAHANVDEDGYVKKIKITKGSIHDSTMLDELLTGYEVEVYADSAYASEAQAKRLSKSGIKNKICRRRYRNKPLSASDKKHNQIASSIRYVVERTFGTFKQHYLAGKTRYMGRVKTEAWITMIAIAHNLKKGMAMLADLKVQDSSA